MGGEAGAGDSFDDKAAATDRSIAARNRARGGTAVADSDGRGARQQAEANAQAAASAQQSRDLAITGPQGGATPDSAPQQVQQRARESLPEEEPGFLSRLAEASPPGLAFGSKAPLGVRAAFTGISLLGGAALAPVTLLGTAMNMLGATPKYKDGTVVAPNESVNDGGSSVARRPSQQPTSRELATQATAEVQQMVPQGGGGGTMTRSTGNGRLALGSATGYRRSLLSPVYRRSV